MADATKAPAPIEVAYCTFCPCRIISVSALETITREVDLHPLPRREGAAQRTAEAGKAHDFWVIKDQMAFDNIGVTRSAQDGRKYLVCADCEMGPIGLVDPEGFLLARDRVGAAPPAGVEPIQQDPRVLSMALAQLQAAQQGESSAGKAP